MILAGISFSLHFAWLRGNTRSVFKNEELRFYLIAILIWSIAIALSLTISGYYRNFLVAIRYASFQVVSIITSTGFSSCNFDDWMRDTARGGSYISLSAIFWLMTLFFIGGCAGSTGGGIKCIRIWILIKTTYRELIRLIHPQSVIPIKINGRVIPEHIINSIVGFFMLYLILTIVFTLTMTWLGLDLFSAFMAVIASIGNTGPGLAKVGPYENYSSIPIVGQWLLIFCMLLGRLELYTVIILLIPSFWKK
jgi:trk system potassium uptake protein TrkH